MPFDDPGKSPEIANPHTRELAILDEMMRLLSRRGGWCQDDYEDFSDHHSSYCLIGALGEAEDGDSHLYEDGCPSDRKIGSHVVAAMARRIRGRRGLALDSVEKIVLWNDVASRRRSDVLKLLRRVRAEFE